MVGILTIEGTGGNGTDNNIGVHIFHWFNDIHADEFISITGTGQGSGTGNHGLLFDDVDIYGGQITLHGTASATGTNASGINITNIGIAGLRSFSGDLTLTGIATGNNTGITLSIDSSFSEFDAYGHDITLNTNSLAMSGAGKIESAGGRLNIRPLDAATTIGLGNGTAGMLNLDANELAMLKNGFSQITIGRPNGTGTVNIGDAAFTDNVLVHGGDFYLRGDISSTATGDAIVMDGTGQGKQGNFYKMGSDIQTPNGRWLVYAYDQDAGVEGSLSGAEHEFGKAYGDAPAFGGSGFVYVLGGETLPVGCEITGSCPIIEPPSCELTGTCPIKPIIDPPSCEELGVCPPALSCEELGTCPPPEPEPSVGAVAANNTLCIPNEELGIDCDRIAKTPAPVLVFIDKATEEIIAQVTETYEDATEVVVESFEKVSVAANTALQAAFSSMAQQLDESAQVKNELRRNVGYAVAGTSLALSFGFMSWMFKSGLLLTALLGVLPMWSRFDPLPVMNLSNEQLEKLKKAMKKAKMEETKDYKGIEAILEKDDTVTAGNKSK